MQLGFYFDQTRCTGCYTCIVACKDWNDIKPGPVSLRRVISIEKGKYPDLFAAFLSISCYHCGKPACVEVCPCDAIYKREEDGLVVVDREACAGCGVCGDACPYDVPQFDEADGRMQKCNFCLDRLAAGQKPTCVGSCPMRALDAGPLEELKAKYGDFKEAECFTYFEEVAPSVVFKPKKDIKGLVTKRLEITPCSRSLLPDGR